MRTLETYNTIVVGAGPAGMMTAGICAKQGARVLVIDKNKAPGRKLRITGKGRCNLTNNCTPEEVQAAVTHNPKFLYSALHRFSPADVMRFFEKLGVPLKTERGKRVFPQSDKSEDIAQALVQFLKDTHVPVITDRALSIQTRDGTVCGIKTAANHFSCETATIACGGASYPGTGSTGDGAALASACGHSIVPLRPSLVPLEADPVLCGSLQGLSLKNCGLQLREAATGRIVYEDLGEMLFTHFGVSGPMVLSASAHMHAKCRYSLHLDLKPGLTHQMLDARILRDFDDSKNRLFETVLSALIPRSLIPVIVRLTGIPGDTRCHSVTRKQRQALAQLLKDFQIEIKGTRPIREAIITAGGVSTKEINPKTMESKLVRGLYFAGETIDVDAYTGGFNLQIAFSTGFLAGMAQADHVRSGPLSES